MGIEITDLQQKRIYIVYIKTSYYINIQIDARSYKYRQNCEKVQCPLRTPSGYNNEQRFDVALLANFSPSPGWITETLDRNGQ